MEGRARSPSLPGNTRLSRGKIWEEILNHLNTCETARIHVNKRSVRGQFKLIKEKFKR